MTLMLDLAMPDSDKTLTREDLSKLTHCPRCGAELLHMYGLAMGGIGGYVVCETDRCDFERAAPDAESVALAASADPTASTTKSG
jgi:hypothetical protein